MYIYRYVYKVRTINKCRKNIKTKKCIQEEYEDSWSDNKMVNTIFVQDFIICEDLVRPIIIGWDFTVSNFIGIIWTKQGIMKVTQDDRIVIEVKEPARGKTLSTTRRIVIPPRQYAKFELECDELEGKFEIKPEPFLQQREPNLWMDSFVVYDVP